MGERDEIAQVLEGLSAAIDKEERARYGAEAEAYVSSLTGLPSAREYERELSPERRKEGALLRELFRHFDGGTRQELWRLEMLYEHHQIVRRQIDSLVKRFEGLMCSVDKSSALLALYETLEREDRRGTRDLPGTAFSGEIAELAAPKHFLPRPETLESWVDLIDGYLLLLTGDPDAYLSSLGHLASLYAKETYGH